MRISDWSSDVCSSDLPITDGHDAGINSPRRMGLRTGSACILVIPPALAQFWRFARRYVGPALERAAFPGYALLLNDGRYALLRNAEAAQRIAGEAERQLARAHDREADALTFEMGALGLAWGPGRGVDLGFDDTRGRRDGG